MLLPIEEVYKEKTFDELMEDEFTRQLFDSISSCEDELDFRDSFPSYISAENQYAILFNVAYYIINEARLNPHPHLRIKEYESYVDGLRYTFMLKSGIYKEIIFTIVYYLASDVLRLDENFCRKVKLRASQYVHNLLFYVSPYSQASDLVDAILPSLNQDSSSKKDIKFSSSECCSFGDVIDDLESQMKDLKNTIQEQKEYIIQLESELKEEKDKECDSCSADRENEIRNKIIEAFILEAEQYPSNQNDKAMAIKDVIHSIIFSEKISLSQNLSKRLKALGRKETVSARSMIEVSGNDKVILGGINNG